jgi:succinate dehydrogenase flavin-adding protein (antitoxin of CptAB toxin-antitoxin module)|tara:strand:- start:2473 stop:2925 length:453 start_codon:yes stop_codon:yes gene_type:complete
MLRAIARRASRAAATTRARAISTARDARDDATDARRRRINRALYRAKQRGFLELDIVVGEWAARAMASTTTTSDGFLDALDAVLDVENPELFKWLTAQETAPREMRENEAYASLAAHCAKFLDEKSSEASRAAHGREWIRGWNDSGAGNQ